MPEKTKIRKKYSDEERRILEAEPWRSESLRVRMAANTNKTAGCWEWMGRKIHHGYGQIGHFKKDISAHRVAWMMEHKAKVPPGMCVCHTCDNTSCVNPSHLFIGTQADNIKDMLRKGRQVKGVAARSAKLSESEVVAIRSLSKSGVGVVEIGEKYGVSNGNISRIVRKKIWRHI